MIDNEHCSDLVTRVVAATDFNETATTRRQLAGEIARAMTNSGAEHLAPEGVMTAHWYEFLELLVDLDDGSAWAPKTLDPLWH